MIGDLPGLGEALFFAFLLYFIIRLSIALVAALILTVVILRVVKIATKRPFNINKLLLFLIVSALSFFIISPIASFYVLQQPQVKNLFRLEVNPGTPPRPPQYGPSVEIREVEDTMNWKTYISEEQGYQIKYPPNWILYERGEAINIRNEENTDEYRDIFIEMTRDQNRVSLMEGGEETYPHTILKGVGWDEYYHLGAFLHKEGNPGESNDFRPTLVLIERHNEEYKKIENRHFIIRLTPNKETEIDSIYSPIVSTFEFVGDWETYTNDYYYFEISYPSGANVRETDGDLGVLGEEFLTEVVSPSPNIVASVRVYNPDPYGRLDCPYTHCNPLPCSNKDGEVLRFNYHEFNKCFFSEPGEPLQYTISRYENARYYILRCSNVNYADFCDDVFSTLEFMEAGEWWKNQEGT